MNYKLIENLIENNKSIVDFGLGTTDFWIKKVELRLKIKFPDSYIWWLKKYNGGEVNGEEIFSIYEEDFDEIIGGDIVYMNELEYGEVSNKLLIHENDQGESYYFNLDESEKGNEYPVYIEPYNIKYADNFLEFLHNKINE